MKIGFIGQGWIGKHYADDFEERGYTVVRYALEEEYRYNAPLIQSCEIVFIAVPTPTTPQGFNADSVRDALMHVGNGRTAVIKSTLLPGTTEKLQSEFSNIYILHSPEFLTEKTAAYDAAHPNRNIIGIPKLSDEYRKRAQDVLAVLPRAPYESILSSRDAEFVKYAGNCYLYTKVIFMNLLYDLVATQGGNWENIREAFINDPRIGASHTQPVHDTGRGAGGHCFIKDFEAFRRMYEENMNDALGSEILKGMAYKNMQLLVESNKNIDLLEAVHGNLNKHRVWKDLRDTML